MSRWRTKGWVVALGLLLALLRSRPGPAEDREHGVRLGRGRVRRHPARRERPAPGPGEPVPDHGTGRTLHVHRRARRHLQGDGEPRRLRPSTRDVTVPGTGAVQVPALTLKMAVHGEEVVVTATRAETSLVNAPATMSVVGNDDDRDLARAELRRPPARACPASTSSRCRRATSTSRAARARRTLSNSQLALLDGRSIYLDFFGLILWDFVPTQPGRDQADRGRARSGLRGVGRERADRRRQHHHQDAARGARARRVDPHRRRLRPRRGLDRGRGRGHAYGAAASTYAGAPNDTLVLPALRRATSTPTPSAPPARPARSPTCTQVGHPLDPSSDGLRVYPADRGAYARRQAYENQGTSQPKFDVRVDQELRNGGRITYSGGYAGTEGIVHTGIGPFDLQSGSYLGYGRVGLREGRAEGRRLRELPRRRGAQPALRGRAHGPARCSSTSRPRPTTSRSATRTSSAGSNILTYGGNARRNNFDITIAPNAEDRNEFGRLRPGRDLLRPVPLQRRRPRGQVRQHRQPRLLAARDRDVQAAARRTPSALSFNRAFRSPSAINNFLDVAIVQPVDVPAGRRRGPAPGRGPVPAWSTRAVGSDVAPASASPTATT